MTLVYRFGRFVGRHKDVSAAVAFLAVIAVVVIVNRNPPAAPVPPSQVAAATATPAQAKTPAPPVINEPASPAVAALKSRCLTTPGPTLAAARKALADGKPADALAVLSPCQPIQSAPEIDALLGKASRAVVAAEMKATKASRKREGVSIGMSEQQALDSSWGRPERVNRTTTAYGTREQWVYGRNYLYFTDGVLTAIQN